MPEQPTISIHIKKDRALEILKEEGWKIEEEEHVSGRRYVYYLRPGGTRRPDGGKSGTDFLWELDEALTQAIEARYPSLMKEAGA